MDKPVSLGQRFGFLGRSFKKKLDEMLREEELTGVQFYVLSALVHLEDSGRTQIRQKELEQATRLAHPTMTEIVKRLEKKEYLSCTPSPSDRRCKSIASTPRALQLRERARRVDQATADWLCRGLTPQQLEQLNGIIDRMIQNVMETCQEGCEDRRD